ncbi:MAG: tRNA (N(6)-L-threonylcarbamoyladenosine(37)-C(2))-methylthiotransferase [Promethearchaeota archaeon]|nr:MAG: tRNA (N(6)-L-threonylcarbamoyladenosine(37)-C(2))-methylthiotransferase [Candidatus Lokiarchaeota archaeon]
MVLKIYIETFGCSYNQASSEILKGILINDNYPIVNSIETGDIIILNTCIVKSNTEARMICKIRDYTRNYPEKKLLITGCMPEVLSESIKSINPTLSMLGPHYVTEVSSAIQSLIQGVPFIRIGKRSESKLCLPRSIANPIIAKIQIAQGCLNNCTYCITKHAMGNLHSYSLHEIVEEVKRDLKQGCREIWLTAQDAGAYGFDIDTTLPTLLATLLPLPSEFRIRIGMMNPHNFLRIHETLLQILPQSKIYNFLHVPIQSGNDQILQKMNRLYSSKEVDDLLIKFRGLIPDLSLSIDIIVGFPSETELQFEDTLKFIQKVRPDIVNISKFGARPKTKAANMKPVPTKVVKERSTRLTLICNELAAQQNKKYLQQFPIQRALTVARGRKGGIIAHTSNYKPVIIEENCELGQFYDIQLTRAHQTYLEGRII